MDEKLLPCPFMREMQGGLCVKELQASVMPSEEQRPSWLYLGWDFTQVLVVPS